VKTRPDGLCGLQKSRSFVPSSIVSPEKRRIDGRLHDCALTGLGELPERHEDRLYDVGHHLDESRLRRPAEALLHPLAEEGGQSREARVHGVPEVVASHEIPEGALNRLGDRKVHVSHPRGEHVVAIEPPLLSPTAPQGVEVDPIEIRRRTPKLRLARLQGRGKLAPVDWPLDLEPRPLQVPLEVAPQLANGPGDRVLEGVERRDLVPARWVVVKVRADLEAVEAQALVGLRGPLADAERAAPVAPHGAMLDAQSDRSEIPFPHGRAL
jgi:hypothetical protein